MGGTLFRISNSFRSLLDIIQRKAGKLKITAYIKVNKGILLKTLPCRVKIMLGEIIWRDAGKNEKRPNCDLMSLNGGNLHDNSRGLGHLINIYSTLWGGFNCNLLYLCGEDTLQATGHCKLGWCKDGKKVELGQSKNRILMEGFYLLLPRKTVVHSNDYNVYMV